MGTESAEVQREKWQQENKRRYARLTPEQKVARRSAERERLLRKRGVETPEDRERRQARYRRQKKGYYPRLTPEARAARIAREVSRREVKWADETPGQTEARRAKYRASSAAYRANHPDYNAERSTYQRQRATELKADIFDALGGVCVGCQEEDERLLQVDHINGGGAEHRKRGGSTQYWKTVLDSVLAGRDEFQLLCANCHMLKSYRS